ncbi:FG-GAP-like repeat-containing protein [Lysobacter fragariae]
MQFRELPLKRLSDLQARNLHEAMVKATQIGVPRTTRSEGLAAVLPPLKWVASGNGGSIARIQVRSPDALGLRVGLQLDGWNQRIELRMAGSDEPAKVMLVRGDEALRLSDTRKVYWTPSTDGETQTIELYAPAGVSLKDVRLQVPQVSHLVASSRNNFKILKSIGDSGACNVDTACRVAELGAAFVTAKNAVAHMQFVDGASTYICTGTLLNDNDSGTQIPYFYGANHCISTQTVANTLITFWNLEATSCGSGISAAVNQVNGGAALLYHDANTDATLLRLNNPPPGGATFGGWDAAALPTSINVLAIHHPHGDLKKVSQGQHVSTNATQHTVGWLTGTTEGGSSGSGLFTLANGSYYLRGGLYRGSAGCENSGSISNVENRDEYSRFDVAFPSIKQYLQPITNVSPVANFSYTSNGTTLVFTDASTDSDGTIASRAWNFGDGTTSTAANPSRTYASGGTYNVTLNVTDNYGGTGSVTKAVVVPVTLTATQSATNLGGAAGAALRYSIKVPQYAQNLRFTTSGGTGNADLYVRLNAEPSTTNYAAASKGATNAEAINVASPTAGTWNILLYGAQAFSGVTLKATYDGGDQPVTIKVTGTTTSEASPQATFVVTSSATSGSPVTFTVASSNGTAQAGSDYTALAPVQMTLPAGAKSIAGTVQLINNATIEPLESFTVTASNVSGATFAIAGDAVATMVVKDDDGIRGIDDFDGDGRSDLFWRNEANGKNDLWKSANATTRQVTQTVADLNWKAVLVGDFNGDDRRDVFWRNGSTGANDIWLSANASTRQAPGTEANLAWKAVAAGDFNNDGRDDVFWRNTSTGANSVWWSGLRTTSQSLTAVADQNWQVMGAGDFNGDGNVDVLWRNASTGANSVWYNATGTKVALPAVTDLNWKAVGIGDFNGDGKADIFWRNSATGGNAIWKSADRSTQQAVTTVADGNWRVAATGDYNADGTSDVAWRNISTGANDVWYSALSSTHVGLATVSDLNWKIVH